MELRKIMHPFHIKNLKTMKKLLFSILIISFFLPSCKDLGNSAPDKEKNIMLNEEQTSAPETGKKDESSGYLSVTGTDGVGFMDNKSLGNNAGAFKNPETKSISPISLDKTKVVRKIPEKIIRTANIRFSVADYSKSRMDLEKLVLQSGGYISSENEQNNSWSKTNDMVIRIDNKDFYSLVNGLTPLAKNLDSKTISTDDVTAQFVDMESRLKSKRELESSYLMLLKKATTVQDILDVTSYLQSVREEIESMQGQLNLMQDQVSYSTINLTFYQTIEGGTAPDEPGFFSRIATSFERGWNGLLDLLVGFVGAWPVWLILAAITYGIIKLIKRIRKKAPVEVKA
jgi:hypothetical protein